MKPTNITNVRLAHRPASLQQEIAMATCISKTGWAAFLAVLAAGTSAIHAETGAPAFTSIQSGDAQVAVTVAVPAWVTQVTLESCTNLQTGGWTMEAVQNLTNNGSTTFQVNKSEPMKLLRARGDVAESLSGRANMCISLIGAVYGAVPLNVVSATYSSPTDNPTNACSIEVICPLPNGHTAKITSPVPGVYGPITDLPYPLLGNFIIPWPLPIDVNEADHLLKAAGYTGTYGAIALQWPVVPGFDEPYYIFQMTGGQRVFVGVNSRRVFQ
jgi:hypothetical protein